MIDREDIELYVMNEFDGDAAALERELAGDPALAAVAADEARLELLLRDAASEATFCAACGDLVADTGLARCDACGAASRPGGYVVERVLVSNAHGRMYVAHDADGKQVALKELAFVQSPSLDAIAAFEREAKLLRALEHPAIPRFVASFEEGTGVHTRYYLAQELVTGDSLDGRLADHFYDEAELIGIARQVLDVLVYLQSVSPMVIHRDIKPANLIRTADGRIAVVDFGAAHVQGTTAGSTSIGTFGYMPIEQLAGQVDATTDAYALGASLLHLSSRREPWRVLQGASIEGVNVSAPMRDWLAKLTAGEPAARFANAAAARDALDKVARGERFDDALALRRRKRSRMSWWKPVALAAAAFALAAGGFGIHAWISDEPREAPQPAGNISQLGMFRFELGGQDAQVFIDGSPIDVHDQDEIPAAAGKHALGIVLRDGQRCDHTVMLVAGEKMTVACQWSKPDPKPDPKLGTLHVQLFGTPMAVLMIDGRELATVRDGFESAVPPGKHLVRMVAAGGQHCDQTVELVAGKTTAIACSLRDDMGIVISGLAHVDNDHPKGKFRPDQCKSCHKNSTVFEVAKARLAVDDRIPAGQPVDVDVKEAPVHDVLRTVAEQCKVNLVVPDSIDARITLRLVKAPCDQALEVLLEAHGLWYRYRAVGNLVRVATRHDLDREAAETAARVAAGEVDDPLPTGPDLDLDFKRAPLHDVLRMFADMAKVNIVVPDHIDGKVTIRLHRAPWSAALQAILESHGLWYRYRPNGKLLRIATRHDLDREAAEARARQP